MPPISKIFGFAILGAIAIALLTAAGLFATGNSHVIRAMQNTWLSGERTANINDHAYFDTRMIAKEQTVQAWSTAEQLPLTPALTDYLEEYNAAAFLVLKNGEIISEHYLNGYSSTSKTNSFSMAKSIVTMLMGIAESEGVIPSRNQLVSEYFAEFAEDAYGKTATLAHLSTMDSGYRWNENYYSVFSPMVKLYYGYDVEDYLRDGDFEHQPGSHYYYSSASTQILSESLSKALERQNPKQTLSAYLSEKLWKPLGMDDDGVWHLDASGSELGYCCINTNARNFAKFGQLLLNNGQWNEQQLIPAAFIEDMLTTQAVDYYTYSLWTGSAKDGSDFYCLCGHRGQYVVVIPAHNMVVVRLGETRESQLTSRSKEIPFYIEQIFVMLDNIEAESK